MVAAYSSDLREKIVQCYRQGETMRSVAEIFNVSVGFVYYAVDPHRKYGQVTDPHAQPRSGHQILTSADEDYIRTPIEAIPSIHLDEIWDKLFFEHGVYVSLATILWTLARLQISKKSLSRRTAERMKGFGPSGPSVCPCLHAQMYDDKLS